MVMEHRGGRKVKLICGRCKKMFLRPAITIRPEQKDFFCSRDCLKKTDEEKRETKKAAAKKWIEANYQKHLDGRKIWRLKNKGKIREYKKKEYRIHIEKIKKANKKRYQNNRENILNKKRQHYNENKDKYHEYGRKNRLKHPEYYKKYRKQHWERNRHSVLWSSCKKSARVCGVQFNLTQEWIKKRLDDGICEMSGLPFDMNGKRTPNSPSIDRIKAGGDYTMDNCRIILWSLNRALSNYGEEYIFKIFDAISKKRSL